MPAWGEIVSTLGALADDQKGAWINQTLNDSLKGIAKRRDTNVLLYASSWLQKPHLPSYMTQIMHEDINGFMTCIHSMDWSKGLTLILHTPGGAINAAETIVEYLHSKFDHIETIVPVYSMSAGTMITLGTNAVIMGRQSQLGPIDPQLPMGGVSVSARAIVEQFNRAHSEIAGDAKLAHVWAPIIQSLGPALLTESSNALSFGERMVANWLEKRMFAKHADPAGHSKSVASFFNDASMHLSHGRRIDRDEARSKEIPVIDLEDDQDLQEDVLTAYHLATVLFELSPAAKVIYTSHEREWIKNLNG